jgi:predicted ATPase/DNA-binding winged helix-turn-helix (wHTH) protein
MSEQTFSFGPFLLCPSRRLLLEDGKKLRLGSRAFDLLVALVNRAGDIISKEELIAAAWPGTFVEETSLRVHIAALRRALGGDGGGTEYIANIPGRGYSFVATLGGDPMHLADPPASPVGARASLPRLKGRVVGRAAEIAAIADKVAQRPLVTIVGPGGIGKTTVALSVALALSGHIGEAVFVDLTQVSEGRLVPGAVAASLGQSTRSDDPTGELVAALRGRHVLLVLDNCEHVVEAAAALAEALSEVPGVQVLATSREALRAAGEWVHRLPALNLPLENTVDAAAAMASPAVELFVERAAQALGGYELTDSETGSVVDICRKLDGIALAIELAAGRLDAMGVPALASSLGGSLDLLRQGRRTALPRHQTLRAALDWSYGLLTGPEQLLLRHLAVFSGSFTAADACAVAGGPAIPSGEVAELARGLATKSLLVADLGSDPARYRLLATTRAFAREKLVEASEEREATRRHALRCRALFRQAEAEWESLPTSAWLSTYAGWRPDLRLALEYAFSCPEDVELGIDLAVAAVPLWYELSAIDECLHWVGRALVALEADPDGYRQQRMRLHAALGWPSMRAVSGLPHGAAAWSIALELAEELGDLDYQLRALWALWVARTNEGRPLEALALADRFWRLEEEVVPEEEHRIGRRMRARSLHLLGRPEEALADIETMLQAYEAPDHRSHVARFQYDQRVTARITLGRVLWVRGLPDQALAAVQENIVQATALGHVLTLTHALSDGACPVALLAGDLAMAEGMTALLEENTGLHALDVWQSYAQCFRGELLIRRGQAVSGVALLRRSIATLRTGGFVLYHTSFLCALAQGLAALGRIPDALTAITEGIEQCSNTGEAWCLPELLRLRGMMLAQGGDGPAGEAVLRHSLALATEQGALSWALRSATDLARLTRDNGKAKDGIAILEPVIGRFSEGWARPDLSAATALLAELEPA